MSAGPIGFCATLSTVHLRPCALIVLILCAGGWTAQLPTSPKPHKLTVQDLQSLRWIVGTWRGTGGGVPPFVERYRFENPTTLVMEQLENERVTSTSRYELRNGEFRGGSAQSIRVATAFDAGSITFEFLQRDRSRRSRGLRVRGQRREHSENREEGEPRHRAAAFLASSAFSAWILS